MARPRDGSPTTRPARLDDLERVLALRSESEVRTPAGRPRRASAGVRAIVADASRLRTRFHGALVDPDSHVVVAEIEGVAVGFAWMHCCFPDVLGDERAVILDYLLVSPAARHRGVGARLLDAVVGYAEERGADLVHTWASPGDRDVNRYLARLGFAQLAVRRAVATPALRRRLAQAELPFATTGRALRTIPVLRRPGRPRVQV